MNCTENDGIRRSGDSDHLSDGVELDKNYLSAMPMESDQRRVDVVGRASLGEFPKLDL